MAGRYLSELYQEMTYRSILLKDKVITLPTTDLLNDTGISLFGIGNTYMNTDTDKKVYFI